MFSLHRVILKPQPVLTRLSYCTPALRTMKTVAIPNQSDNYSYLLIDDATQKAAAFDTYDVAKVQSAAEKMGVTITANLTTHHHFDHSGGNEVSILPGIIHPVISQTDRTRPAIRTWDSFRTP